MKPLLEPLENQRGLEALRETASASLADAVLDRDQALVRNVALLGPESRNGYRYTLEAMAQAAPLYDGRPVFIDHPETAVPTLRKLRDYAGQVTAPRFENERVRGDLRLIGPNARWLLGLIEAAPRDLGMSHVVLARRDPSGQAVERIERVLSVDIVAFPATTQSFVEAGTRNREAIASLLAASSLPPEAQGEELLAALSESPAPARLLAWCERIWRRLEAETPRAQARHPGEADRRHPGGLRARQALVAAIRGG